jgi:hypothetical protein
MKKILLSAAAIFAAMSMNAQEFCSFNPDNALNLDAENGTALTAGTVIGETTSIVAKIGADDTYKPQSATFTANGEIISGGLQGASNPKDADGGTPATTLIQPASGAFLVFEAKADGFLYVMHKASSNKAYTVFEEGTAISYTFAAIGDASSLLGGVYSFTLPYEVENEQFVVKNAVEWAEQEFLKSTNPDAYAANWKEETADDGTTKQTWDPAIKINGLGVIKFPVYKDCKYIVNANGSKITAAGFAFSTEDNVLIQSDDVVIYKGEGAAEPVKKVYSVIGTINGNWDVDTDMKLEDGLYTVTFENIAAGTYEWKIRQDHEWTINWGDNGDGTGVQDGKNFIAELPEGSSMKITFDPATAAINAYVVGGAIEPQPAGGVIWEGDGSAGAVSWNGTYRFALEGHDGASECIAEIPQATWDKMMTETFYVDLEAATPQVRITNGWWDVEWVGGDIQPGNELLTDNGDGTFTLKVELANQPDLVATLLDKHLLFTGANYTPIKIYFAGGETAINSVKKAANADDAIYNVAGQKVNASYKGLVIKNGKKYIQK